MLHQMRRFVEGPGGPPFAAAGGSRPTRGVRRYNCPAAMAPRTNDATVDDPTAHLLAWPELQPFAPALVVHGRPPLTFHGLAERIRAVRSKLEAWGISRGDAVVWLNVDRPESAAAQAIMPSSSTIMPVSASITADAGADILGRVRPKAVAVPQGSSHLIAELAHRLRIALIEVRRDPLAPAGAFDIELVRPDVSLESPQRMAPDIAWLLGTSGSTGKPKLVPHGRRQVMAMIRAVRERLGIGPGDVSAHAVPLHLANGMRAAYMWSLLNGGAVEILPEADPDALLAAIARGGVSYYSASFAIQRELLVRLAASDGVSSGRLRFVRVASGRLEPEEMDRLEALLNVPVITGLASSESGFVAHQGLPPMPRLRGSVGTALGSEIRIVDDRVNDVPPGEVGEILVRGPQVFDGYLDDPSATAAAFSDGWVRMGDLGRRDEHGERCVVGRVKEIINRGGEKLSPSAIDPVMRAVRGVADAAAFGIPHPRLGEEVVAAVVRAHGGDCVAEDVIAAVRAKLGPRAAPRHVWFVDRLPRNDAGKLQRNLLADRFGAPAAAAAFARDAVETRTPLEIALAALWSSVLGVDRVHAHDRFFAPGGDVRSGAQLAELIRSVFGVAIRPEVLLAEPRTLRSMSRAIEARLDRTEPAPLDPAGPQHPAAR
jgi:acyl-CoA synthetase (AMP-forming)/AMP-acid ligase II